MKKILYSILAVALLLSSCKDDYDSSYEDDPTTLPAATYMEMEEEQTMSLWVDLLKYTNMFNTMNLSANYTCFVPDNDAMKDFMDAKGISSVEQIDMDDALLLVRYHTIKGAKYSSVDFRDGLVSDSTASGDYLSTQFVEGGALVINTEAKVNKTVQVTNGYIHRMNAVLTPVSETLWGMLNTSSEYTVMKEVYALTGLKDRLDSIRIDYKKVRYTLFAVPDDVYQREGITNVQDLIATLGAGNNYTDPANELYKYGAYHLISQQLSYISLAEFELTDTIRSKNYSTMAEDQLFNLSEVNQALYINYNKTTQSGAGFTTINKNAKNGVIHVIDGIMPVEIPAPSRVEWEFTDYSELSVISFYRKTPGTNTQTAWVDSVTCYQFEAVPASRTAWEYVLANKNDEIRKKAKNNDLLKLNLGLMGWIQMESPTIIAGKYKVSLRHYSPRATEKAGRLSFIIDGEYLGSQITTTGDSSTAETFTTNKAIGEIEFTESKKHTLRILTGDNTTSEIDCLVLEPIN